MKRAEHLDADAVVAALRKATGGNISQWARDAGLSAAYVCEVLRGRKQPGLGILLPLGYRRVVRYVKEDHDRDGI